ncbi:MAG: hypothetical protein ACTSV6_02520, partial [Candidatus Heimdallarchaeota archaeon]
ELENAYVEEFFGALGSLILGFDEYVKSNILSISRFLHNHSEDSENLREHLKGYVLAYEYGLELFKKYPEIFKMKAEEVENLLNSLEEKNKKQTLAEVCTADKSKDLKISE